MGADRERARKSVVTCDMEGRIQTFNDGAEAIFGYDADEVVGKARVSLFSPGEIVLGHVGKWLAEADETGSFDGRSVFVRKDGSRFAADIRITPTSRKGERLGYCGVTVPRDDVDPDEAMPRIGLGTRALKWLVITRAPFLTAALLPVLIAAAWAGWSYAAPIAAWHVVLAALGACALQIAANTFNDYYDWRSGTDQANTEYFQQFSGGSRAIELGLVSARGMFRVGLVASLVAASVGIAFLALRGPEILWFGLAGLFSAIFYTAPPLRLVARKGLGELLIGLNGGPLMTGGTVYALTGTVAVADFLIGLPIGLLTTAILWINEFPDAESDAATGKEHLVVVLGKEAARWGYVALLAAAFGLVIAGAVTGLAPWSVLASLLALPFGVKAVHTLFRHLRDRELVRACSATILLHLATGSLLAAGLLVSSFG